MSLAALGCNPDDKGTADEVGGHQPGTIAFSPDGGMYVLIQASEAIAQYDTCHIHGAWQISPMDAANDNHLSNELCIVQADGGLANGDFGWGLVYGNGTALAAADIDVSTSRNCYAHNNEGEITTVADDLHIGGMQYTGSVDVDVSADGKEIPVAVQWPRIDLIA